MQRPSDINRFLTAGKAILTLKSEATQKHYTYQVIASDTSERIFVRVLTGPDNSYDYMYIGYCYVHKAANGIMIGPMRFGAKGQPDHPASKAWIWAAKNGFAHESLSVHHEGRCGACGRRLTTPESISLGLGPECATRV